MTGAGSDLSFIDEHDRLIEAAPLVAWAAAVDVLSGSAERMPRALVHVLGLEPSRAGGPRPLQSGSALPGFRVTCAVPGRRLVLDGRHRFSRYRLDLTVDRAGAELMLRARSYATFPGLHGAAYRALVIGSGGHVVAVRRMLERIARRAEHRAGGGMCRSAF